MIVVRGMPGDSTLMFASANAASSKGVRLKWLTNDPAGAPGCAIRASVV